ncbi:hypothetical protein CC2G_003452 [Coprinopsis cinerea AmutBmut pab1-1]|nr:hypothetical protein CC2G_003452 [Coprinopsis cinerea AmutBmut pab1-1]
MSGRRDSWTKQYQEVEYDLGFERDRMLPGTPSAPSTPVSAHHQLQPASPLHHHHHHQQQQQQQFHQQQQQGFQMSQQQQIPPGYQQQQHQQPTVSLVMSPSSPNQQLHFGASTSSRPSTSQGQGQTSSIYGSGSYHHDQSSAAAQDSNGNNAFTRSPRASSFKSFPSSPLKPASPFGATQQQQQQQNPLPRSSSASNAPSLSGVNGGGGGSPPFQSPFGRPGSRASINFSRMPSDIGAHSSISAPYPGLPTTGSRGSMILYRRADSMIQVPTPSGMNTPPLQASHTGATDDSGAGGLLPPPGFAAMNRASVYSTSGDSMISMGSDSKYPASMVGGYIGGGYGSEPRGLVAYAYDPDEDDDSDDGEDDWLHDPEIEYPGSSSSRKNSTATRNTSTASSSTHGAVKPTTGKPRRPPKVYSSPIISWRGVVNISTLVAMVAALLCLFVVYPMVRFYTDAPVNERITGNLRINATGQAVEDDVFDSSGTTGSPGQGGGGTPTGPRISTTVTQINQGGVIFDRRWWSGLGLWKREEEDWDLPFPSTSYDIPGLSTSLKRRRPQYEQQPLQHERERRPLRSGSSTIPSRTVSEPYASTETAIPISYTGNENPNSDGGVEGDSNWIWTPASWDGDAERVWELVYDGNGAETSSLESTTRTEICVPFTDGGADLEEDVLVEVVVLKDGEGREESLVVS